MASPLYFMKIYEVNKMEITRNQIEDEENYKKLQKIGRAFRKEGHKLVLNAPEDELKKRLLVIFDESYSKDVETEPEPVVEPEVILTPEPEPVVESKPKESDGDLYFAPVAYKDLASGWQFRPGMDKPKPLPKELTPGLKNAIKAKRIIPFEG